MKKLLLLALLAVPLLQAQPGPVSIRPDCFQFFTFTATGNSLTFDNRQAGCPYWTIVYTSNGFSALSIVLQVAPDAGGTPGTWATYTATTGSNPNTATTQADSLFNGPYFPWLRVQLTSKTGTGSVSGIFYGYRVPAVIINGGGVGSGCVGTAGTPCVVDGPTSSGSPPTTPPVLSAGQDGTNIQTLKVDTAGRPQIAGAGASGAAKAGNPVQVGHIFNTTQPTVTNGQTVEGQASARGSLLVTPGIEGFPVIGPNANGVFATPHPVVIGGIFGNTQTLSLGLDQNGGIFQATNNGIGTGDGVLDANINPPQASGGGGNMYNFAIPTNFNGTTWDRQFACTNRANIALTTIGLTRVITGTAAKKVRLCSLSLSFAAPVDVQVVEGTKVATDCDTGATNMSGLYRSVVGFDPNLSNLFALTEGTAADDVCISMSASVNGGGTAIYAVF